MKKTLTILIIGLALVACSPAADFPVTPAVSQPPAATTTTAPYSATATPTAAAESPTQTPQALPTSRGDALQATDPRTVTFGNGQPMLLEFFAFW